MGLFLISLAFVALSHVNTAYGNVTSMEHKDTGSFIGHMLQRMGRAMFESHPDSRTCDDSPESDMNVVEFIRHHDYPVEEHFVQTDDGYTLALHRIPGDKNSPVVLLQHPLIASSYVWVSSGKEKALAFILADKGYDVWMGNVRGNTYSKNHTTLSELDEDFWDFSWHEMGVYDLPAEILYITSMRKKKLTYVGHSMGTTVFFVMATQRPDVASKVRAMFALAPAAYNDALVGSTRLLEPLLRELLANRKHMDGKFEFLGTHPLIKYLGKCVCNRPVLREICEALIFSAIGYPPVQFNRDLIPLILSHHPSGTSFKTFLHFLQCIDAKEFRHFDYGPDENLRLYNSQIPPIYNLSEIQVPIGLFWGENDFVSVPKNVARLYQEIPRRIGSFRIDHQHFNHIDFLWGVDAPKLVYKKLLELIERYDGHRHNH